MFDIINAMKAANAPLSLVPVQESDQGREKLY